MYNEIRSAVVSYRNSTSNHNNSAVSMSGVSVVSYRNSTSNHNSYVGRKASGPVVSYRNSTSNHNCWVLRRICLALYLIEILHQTTTIVDSFLFCYSCILSKFYIKPQHWYSRKKSTTCCILSKFYIKPQPWAHTSSTQRVVSYRNSTSNHNNGTTYDIDLTVVSYRNSTSNHNISPRQGFPPLLYLIEILHQTTTKRLRLLNE